MYSVEENKLERGEVINHGSRANLSISGTTSYQRSACVDN